MDLGGARARLQSSLPSYVSMRKLPSPSVPQFPLLVAKRLGEEPRSCSRLPSSLPLLTPECTAVAGLSGLSGPSVLVLWWVPELVAGSSSAPSGPTEEALPARSQLLLPVQSITGPGGLTSSTCP